VGKNENKKIESHIIFPVKVGNHLFSRLVEHINELAFLKNVQISKQDWLAEAIEEKLQSDKDQLGDDEQLRQKSVFPKISKRLNDELESRVNVFKQSRISYSKKQWIVDAIYEKLDRDTRQVKRLIKEKIDTSGEK
jgi:hypothetical protein